MLHIGYKAVGTFLDDGCRAIKCLKLVEDAEKHGNLTEKKWRIQTLGRANLRRFGIGNCGDICALLYMCYDGIPRLVEHIEREPELVQFHRHSGKPKWKVKVKCQNYDMPIDIPCRSETACFVYLEALASELESEKLVIYDLRP